jgi:altronate dehydratase
VLKNGGGAVLAETDELIGAESHILGKVRNRTVAEKFLRTVQNFKDWMSWHGQTAENNPSGGNKLRGIYNITLKSIGAGMKKPKDVRLDYVVDYGELQKENYGYTFMNSPGNDLESVAGQVATGCNFILFTTGNGAVTNHPFVPTLKVITTTRRYELLKHDMDFNAGRFQDPSSKVPIDVLGKELFNTLKQCASGKRTIGEIAGHSQVQLWRSWHFTSKDQMKTCEGRKLDQDAMKGDAKRTAWDTNCKQHASIDTRKVNQKNNITCNYVVGGNKNLNNYNDTNQFTSDSVALIIATSLCSSEVSQQIADILNKKLLQAGNTDSSITVTKNSVPITRFVCCSHTEGCGSMHADGNAEANIPFRTLLGHLKHPSVATGFLVEHGCEKHHNKYFKQQMKRYQMDPCKYGWASIQLGGGLKNCISKCVEYFFPYEEETVKIGADITPILRINNTFPLPKMKIGVYSIGNSNRRNGKSRIGNQNTIPEQLAIGASEFIQYCLQKKAVPIMSSQCLLLKSPLFLDEIFESQNNTNPTIAFAQIPPEENENSSNGLHIMNAPTKELIETFTAFAASGCIVTVIFSPTMVHVPNHPFMPVVLHNKFDTLNDLLKKIVCAIECNSRKFGEKSFMEGFQIARGLTGISV